MNPSGTGVDPRHSPRYPVIAGYELDEDEQHLVSYWLGGREPAVRRVDQAEILRGKGGLLYHPRATRADLREILEWNLPLLIVAGRDTALEGAEFLGEMRELGAAAIWELPERDAPVLPPPVSYEQRFRAYLLADRQPHRRRYRQLLFYCGMDVRVDFQSGADLLTVLERESETPGEEPTLLIIDLDSTRLDGRAFFPALRRLLEERTHLRRACGILLTKDFSRTGTDIQLIAGHIRALTKRIFAPDEAFFALLEGLLYAPLMGEREPNRTLPRLRSLRDLLVGDNAVLHDAYPVTDRRASTDFERHAQLFRWWYNEERRQQGLPLNSPELR